MGAAADFRGAVDGQGVKAVMTAPKNPIQLITPQFIEGIAQVLLYGATKYAPNNWMRGMAWTTLLGGIFRHLCAMARGEDIDPETGLPHCLHAACGLMFWHWYAYGPTKDQHAPLDDRVFTPPPLTASPYSDV